VVGSVFSPQVPEVKDVIKLFFFVIDVSDKYGKVFTPGLNVMNLFTPIIYEYT
jgi:hypothetical protein